MKTTEKYIIFITDGKDIAINGISEIWMNIAAKLSQEFDLYPYAIIQKVPIVCNSLIGCHSNYTECVQITCVRNPIICNDSDVFMQCFHRCYLELKSHYPTKHLTIESSNVDISFFPSF